MLGSIVGAIGSLIGGSMAKDAQSEANRINQENAMRQEALQREFAQSGIQWKVADAQKAGIHPLYALGANTVSYAPSVVGATPETGLASAVSSSSQDISRALEATRTASDSSSAFTKTAQQLALTKGGLENELLATQIAKMRGQLGPNMPSLADKNVIEGQSATRKLQPFEGFQSTTPAAESTQDAISKEYGDEGLPQLPGQFRFLRDMIKGWYNHHEKYGWNRGTKQFLADTAKRLSNPNRGTYRTPDYQSYLYY